MRIKENFIRCSLKKIAEAEVRLQKHSEVRPHSGQVYNYKALQRVGGEPPVLQAVLRLGAIFLHMNTYEYSLLRIYRL